MALKFAPPIQTPLFLNKDQQILSPEWSQWFYDIFTAVGAGTSTSVLESRTISTSEGITGGGNLTEDRTLTLDVNGLTEDTSPDTSADFVVSYDTSAGTHKKISINNLPTQGEANTVSNIGSQGTGLFDEKQGIDLQFKNIDSPASTLSLTDNTTNKTLELEVANGIRQVQRTTSTADASTTSTIPLDNTIPQNTEGTELFTVSITPKKTDNLLKIEVELPVISTNTNGTTFIGALFQDSTANALATSASYIATSNTAQYFYLVYYMAAGTTSSTTLKFRYGGNANTVYVNQLSGGGVFSTSTVAHITVTEIEP